MLKYRDRVECCDVSWRVVWRKGRWNWTPGEGGLRLLPPVTASHGWAAALSERLWPKIWLSHTAGEEPNMSVVRSHKAFNKNNNLSPGQHWNSFHPNLTHVWDYLLGLQDRINSYHFNWPLDISGRKGRVRNADISLTNNGVYNWNESDIYINKSRVCYWLQTGHLGHMVFLSIR